MNKQALIDKILSFKNKINFYNLNIGCATDADFVMGYYFVSETGEYIVYMNEERGMRTVWATTTDEIKALKELLAMVEGYAAIVSNV